MISKIVNYFTSSYEEMKKVIWPSRNEVTSHTVIVVLSMLIGMAIVAAIDFAFFNLIQILILKG